MTHRKSLWLLPGLTCLILFTSTVSATRSASLPDDIRFRRYSVDQGLSQSQVSAIIQDGEGYIWLATQDGLDRFDGYTFKVYRHDARDSLSISDNYITCLFVDSAGDLWIGTYSGGLNRYDRGRDGFSHFVHDTSGRTSISGNNVWSVTEDRSGALWVGVWAGGLNKFDRASGTWTLFCHDPNDSTSLIDDRVLCQLWDHEGKLWVGTFAGLDCFDPARGTFVHQRGRFPAAGSVSQGLVTAICEDHKNNLWIGTLDNGLDEILPDRSRVIRYRHTGDARTALSSNRIGAIVEDRSGILWIATRDGGVNLLDDSLGQLRRVVHNPHDAASLSVDAAISLSLDNHGGIWVGTDGGGVNHFDPQRFKFHHFASEPGNLNSLANPLIRSICEDHTGIVWVGMMNGNLDAVDVVKGKVTHYRDTLLRRGLQSSCQVLSILEDTDRNLWVGTDGSGLFLFDRKRNTVGHFVNNPEDQRSIPDDYVVALYEANDGKLWIGGTSGKGLGIMDRRTHGCTRMAHRLTGTNQLSGNYVWAILQDRRGKFWFGTWGSGISVFDPRTSQFQTYQHDAQDTTSLSNNTILAFLQDSSGTIWIATLGGGLDEFSEATGKFIHHSESEGLPNNNLSGILQDDRGGLWVSTNKGLSRFDPRTKSFRNYDISDGLQSSEFNQGAYCKGRSGRMYFGGINGMNVFVPEEIGIDTANTPVRITSFKVLDRVVQIAASTSNVAPVSIAHDQTSFSVEFALLDFVAPEKTRYSYELEGFDADWIRAGTRRFATYTNLSGGEYQLRVRAQNSDGIWSTREATLAIRILPPYWETLWFRALALFAVFAVGFVIVQIRMSQLRREHAIQSEFSKKLNEYQETERRRIAGELHDSLGQDLLIIRNSLTNLVRQHKRATGLAREVKDIGDSVQRTIEEVSKISFDLHPHMLDRLGLKKTIEATIRKYSVSSSTKFRGEIDDVDRDFTSVEQIQVFRIIQEAINNVLKHANALECQVAVRRLPRLCEISIADNGCGFVQDQPVSGPSSRVGYGLVNMEERVRMLHGTVQIRSAPGAGTALLFQIPLSSPREVDNS